MTGWEGIYAPPERTLRGLEAEHAVAVSDGKLWVAKKVKDQARRLAIRTGQAVPMWAQEWGP